MRHPLHRRHVWLAALCPLMAICHPQAVYAVPGDMLHRASRMIAEDSPNLQRRFLLSYLRLQTALKEYDALEARRQVQRLHILLAQAQSAEVTLFNKGPNGVRLLPALEVILREGVDRSIHLLPFQGPEVNSTTLRKLLVVNDIEPLTIAMASIRYVRTDIPLPETATLIEEMNEMLMEGRYSSARQALESYLTFLVSEEVRNAPPTYRQARDLLEVAEAFHAEACPDIAARMLESAKHLLAKTKSAEPASLNLQDEHRRTLERVSALSRRLQADETLAEQPSVEEALELWARQLDS